MAKRDRKRDNVSVVLEDAAAEERRLLKRERRAERELAELRADLARDQERLERARQRVERRLAEVAAAEARLRERQADRAAGPMVPGSDGAELPAASRISAGSRAIAAGTADEGGADTAADTAGGTRMDVLLAAAPAGDDAQGRPNASGQASGTESGEDHPMTPPLG